MIHVQILYFAGLRERLGRDRDTIALEQPVSAQELWQRLYDEPPAAGLLVAINQNQANWEQTVNDGDEVAFFPPITGG